MAHARPQFLKMHEQDLIRKVHENGGRIYLVGGYVRDELLHRVPHDKDYTVTGLEIAQFERMFPEAQRTGHAFPVYRLPIEGRMAEIAFARSEYKQGQGYRGFVVTFDAQTHIEADLYRRDTTVNSMARELPTGKLIDPFGGQRDLQNHILRATSKHFAEDPVRALRAARQAAVLAFSIAPQTLKAMANCRLELLQEPQERIFKELTKALATEHPSLFFQALRDACLWVNIFPELAEVNASNYAWQNFLRVADEIASYTQNIDVRFASLAFSLGYHPERIYDLQRGQQRLAMWHARMTLPNAWRKAAMLCMQIGACCQINSDVQPNFEEIADILLQITKAPWCLRDMQALIKAWYGKVPLWLAEDWQNKLCSMSHQIPKDLQGKAISIWLRKKRAEMLAKLWRLCNGQAIH